MLPAPSASHSSWERAASRSGRPSRPACRSSAGFTLFELLLVLGLLVALAGIAWPAIDGSFSSARLRTAADRIRAAWSEARLEAMRTGTIHEFRYVEGGAAYQVRAWSAEGLAAGAAATQVPQVAETETSQTDMEVAFSRDTLPEGVTFAAGTQQLDQRAAVTANLAGANVGMEGTYSTPILFYPDGTAVDAVVHLKNEEGLLVRIALRGLTGISRASALMSVNEVLEQ